MIIGIPITLPNIVNVFVSDCVLLLYVSFLLCRLAHDDGSSRVFFATPRCLRNDYIAFVVSLPAQNRGTAEPFTNRVHLIAGNGHEQDRFEQRGQHHTTVTVLIGGAVHDQPVSLLCLFTLNVGNEPA
jgi:hypothetical protein